MLTQKIRTAAIHLATVLKEEGLDTAAVFLGPADNGSIIISTTDQFETIKDISFQHNPIQSMIDNVLQEVCTDCLKLEYYFQDPFFVSLVKAYIEVLVTQYGPVVPITRTLAQVCLQHKLTSHRISFKSGDGMYMFIDDPEAPQFKVNTTQYFLLPKNKENESNIKPG